MGNGPSHGLSRQAKIFSLNSSEMGYFLFDYRTNGLGGVHSEVTDIHYLLDLL